MGIKASKGMAVVVVGGSVFMLSYLTYRIKKSNKDNQEEEGG